MYNNLLPRLNKRRLSGGSGLCGSGMYETPVTGLEDDDEIAPMPYAIMPVEQPMYMVGYPRPGTAAVPY